MVGATLGRLVGRALGVELGTMDGCMLGLDVIGERLGIFDGSEVSSILQIINCPEQSVPQFPLEQSL